MRNRYMLYACLVVLALAAGMVGCGSKKKLPEPAPLAKPAIAAPKANVDRTGWPVIVAFGDSLTAGQGVSFDRNYPSQLQAELDRRGYQYRVVNAGISGDTTGGGLGRVKAVIAQKPEIVILELGPNDALQGKPLDIMKQNLASIIEALQAERIHVVLAGMQIPPNYGPDYTETFRKTFVDLAEQYKLPLIPFFLEGVGGKPDLNQMDGIHPTAEGYVYVVRNVMGVLEPYLKK